MTKTLISALALLSLATGAVPATAKTEPVSVTVEFADLDLSTAQGVDNLERRLAGAIRLACGQPDMKVRASVRAVRQCNAEMNDRARLAIADIVEQPERYAQAKTITVRG